MYLQICPETHIKSIHPVVQATGFAGLKENGQPDLLSQLPVLLIALSLSLGIAFASNFTPGMDVSTPAGHPPKKSRLPAQCAQQKAIPLGDGFLLYEK